MSGEIKSQELIFTLKVKRTEGEGENSLDDLIDNEEPIVLTTEQQEELFHFN